MDILNFISWIKGSRVVNSVDASQTLLPVGLKDPKRDDGYLAGAISVSDFLASIPAEFANATLPSYINRAAAVIAITVPNGAVAGNTYLYYNETTFAIEGIRL